MIVGFKHKGLKRLFEDDDPRGLNPQHIGKIRLVLGALDVATAIEEVDLPTFRLHALTSDLRGLWSITVRANWRIVFRFHDGQADDVDLIDYH